MDIRQFLGPNAIPGTFGDNAMQRAKAAGLNPGQIQQLAASAGLQVMSNQQIQQTPAWQQRQASRSQPAPTPAALPDARQFLGPYAVPGTFGDNAAERARAAGYSDAEITAMAQQAGLQRLSNQQIAPIKNAYDQRFQSSLQQYEQALSQYKTETEQRFESEYQSRFERDFMARAGDLQNQAMTLQSQLSTAEKERADAKAKADELEAQQKAEREMAVSEQLSSLRSGSTASGSAGSGLGSLTSGRSSYSVSTGAKSGGVLDRAYKDIDPTDSVLDKNVASAAAGQAQGSSTANRTQARQRALASGSAASDYYARRFG